jgi:hypothetical protein
MRGPRIRVSKSLEMSNKKLPKTYFVAKVNIFSRRTFASREMTQLTI